MFECAEMEELSLPDMIAAQRLMQLSGRGEEGEDNPSNSPLKNIIKLVCNDILEENRVNLSSKRKVEEIECETPLINAAKRKRYRSLDSIYKKTKPVGDGPKGHYCTAPVLSVHANSDKLRKSLRDRPWTNYNETYTISDSEDEDIPDQAVARCRPDGSCRPILDEALVFHPK